MTTSSSKWVMALAPPRTAAFALSQSLMCTTVGTPRWAASPSTAASPAIRRRP